MRWDWYQATVPAEPPVVLEALRALGSSVVSGRGLNGYAGTFTVRDAAGQSVARVLAGGNSGARPNVAASGAWAEPVAAVLRATWPDHRVTRCDAAEDLAEPGAYDRLFGVCRSVAIDRGVKGRQILPDDTADGRTYYLGAPTSDVRVRLYDKTAEARAALPPERHAEVPDDWARLEVQARPRQHWRAWAARAEPADVWGLSGWSHELAKRALELDIERVFTKVGRESDDERAFRVMCDQYGKVLSRLAQDLGGWECVGLTIGDRVKTRGTS